MGFRSPDGISKRVFYSITFEGAEKHVGASPSEYRAPRTDDVEGLELLCWEDHKEIRNYVQSGGPPDTTTTTTIRSKGSSGIEVSPTSRATCKNCSQKILKAEPKLLQQSTSNTGTKRRKDSGGDQKSKVARLEGDASASRDVSEKSLY